MNALPDEFIERFTRIIPKRYLSQCLSSFQTPNITSFWINTLVANSEDVLKQLQDEDFEFHSFEGFKNTYWVSESQRRKLTISDLYYQGKIYLQNLSSILPPIIMNPKSDEWILDLTAAPGSKTILLSAMMNNQGKISAVEKSRNRFFQLKRNLKKHGVNNVQTYCKDGATVSKSCPEWFDQVLLDAPCSSEARFKTFEPDTFSYWSLKKVNEMAKKQRRLLYSAIQSLKPGGNLIYSTCSFSPEENEAQIDHLLKEFEGTLEIEDIDIPVQNIQPGLTSWQDKNYNSELVRTIRILPNEFMSGFYLCKIKKKSNDF